MFIYLKKIISDRNDIPNINIIPINKLNTNLNPENTYARSHVKKYLKILNQVIGININNWVS